MPVGRRSDAGRVPVGPTGIGIRSKYRLTINKVFWLWDSILQVRRLFDGVFGNYPKSFIPSDTLQRFLILEIQVVISVSSVNLSDMWDPSPKIHISMI